MKAYKFCEEFNLDDKVEYFISYYLYEIELYNKSSSNFSGFDLHSLIKFIIEELSKNDINRNLKIFQQKLMKIANIDNAVKTNYKYKVQEIADNMTSNKEYALIMAENLLLDINNGKYAKKVCDRIKRILFGNRNLEEIKDEINYLTNVLIIEYIIYGYSKKEIEHIIYYIFSKYNKYDEYVTTNFPIPTNLNNKDIINYIDNLTIKNRIDSLKYYFEVKRKKYYYLFNVKGIVGTFLNIHLNNVDIYNWKTAHKFDVEIDEQVRKNIPTYRYGEFEENDIHCAIYIDTVDKESIFERIKQELDEALDILYTHHYIECRIAVDYTHYIVFDEERKVLGEGMRREDDEEFKRKVRPLDYNNDNNIDERNAEYNNYSKYILNNDSDSSQIIKNSVRYYRKGRETTRTEDKILNYWICIENIFKISIDLPSSILDKNEKDSKFNKIFSIAPYLIFKTDIISMYWEVHDYFYNIYLKNQTMIDDKSKKDLQFFNGKINLIDFIKNYELLEDKLSMQLDKDIYEKYFRILNDTSELNKHIKGYMSQMKETLLLLYRYRNMIVHNAQYDITFMEFYIKQLEMIAIRLLNVVTTEIYKNESKDNLQSIIINKYIDQRQMIKDFDTISLKDWLYMQE